MNLNAILARALVVIVLTMLSGCTVGPNYQAPAVPVREKWISTLDTDSADPEWWRKLHDAELDELVVEAVSHNKNVGEASARLQEARANRDSVRGRSLPQATVVASVSKNQLSANGVLPVARIPGFDSEFLLHDAGFDSSWEIDLWGATRRALESANARVQAAEAGRHGVTLQVIAEVVRAYIDLRTAQNLQASAVADAAAQEEMVRIVADRMRVGSASALELARVQAQARGAAAAIPGYRSDAAAAAYRLALLLGQSPEEQLGLLECPCTLPSADLHVPMGLRAELLRRRPDVRVAERELAAATAEVGVATSELFPRLGLVGAVGLQARSTDDVFASDSLRAQVGPYFRWPIFSGGRIRAQIRAVGARADAAAIRYESTVLGALSDSETSINRFMSSGRTRAEREELRTKADTLVSLAKIRYAAGEDDLAVVLQAQSSFFAADRQSIQARAAELQQLAALYKALGGGWETLEIVDK